MNRRQRQALVWLALPTVIVLAYAVKVIGMYASAHQSIAAYWKSDYPAAIDAARGQEFLNWFEPYKAPFNAGVAFAASGAFDQARDRFAEALGLARGLEVCPVRFNLALTIERLGDDAVAAGDRRAALTRYAESLAVTQGTPEECRSDAASQRSSDPSRSMGDSLDAAERRVSEKLGTAQEQEEQPPEPDPQEQPGGGASDTDAAPGDDGDASPGAGQEPPAPGPDDTGAGAGTGTDAESPSPAGIGQLRERMEQSAREREAALARGQQGGSGQASGTERPW